MSVYGYKKKGKKANWMAAFPEQVAHDIKVDRMEKKLKRVIKRIRQQSKIGQQRNAAYTSDAREFVRAARARGETCVVVNTIPELRDGCKYGWPVSNELNEVHHQRGRLGPLLMDKRHWQAISKAGHRWVGSNIAEARLHGWICPAGLWNTPR